MLDDLRALLLSLAQRDLEVRERLARDGSLFQGYHPEMQAVHEKNAEVLEGVLAEHGWPSAAVAGEDGAEAAWLVVQHAIGLPEFQRRCLPLLQEAAADGVIPSWQPAMLLDRIRVFEGRPQIYGTSFDWGDNGQMSPRPIAEPESVDARRAAVGLPPLADAIARHRKQAAGEPAPEDPAKRRLEMEDWAKRVGWRQ